MKLKKLSLLICIVLLTAVVAVQAQLAGQVPLAPSSVPQFVDPLPHFAGLRVNAKAGGNLTVQMVAHQQIAVSTGTVLATGTVGPATPNVGLANFWVYQISTDGVNFTPPMWPAFTIEAERALNGSKALNVTYQNLLNGAKYSDVGLIVDQSLHWAHPMGFNGSNPPAVVHLHGGEVPPLSDGGPDSWFTPDGKTGHAYNPSPYYYPNTQEAATLWFHDHALGATRLNVYAGMAGFYFLRGPDEETAQLPGWSGDDLVQEAAGGFAGTRAYLPEIEIAIQDRMFDMDGKLYFPNIGINPEHPQWVPEFIGDIITVNGKTWPYLSVAPRKYRFRFLNGSNARFYELWLQDLATGVMGPVINQIGTDGGLLDAPVAIDPNLGGKLIIGPGERADVVIDFSANPGAVWTLRNSGRTPYPKGGPANGRTVGRIMQFIVNGTMVDGNDANTTAEDNSQLPAALRAPLVQLTNNWTTAPNPAIPGTKKVRLLTLNEFMGPGGPLEVLVNNTKWGGQSVAPEITDPVTQQDYTAVTNDDGSITFYSETTDEGKTEIWKIVNLTADAHPIHLHLVQFQLLSRQNFNFNKYNKAYDALFPASAAIDPMTMLPYPGKVFIGGYGPPKPYNFYATAPNIPVTGPIYGGNPDVTPYLQGAAMPANPNERGWKDTFIMYPGQVTTVIARWTPTDKAANLDPTVAANEMWFPFNPNGGHGYVWHCHIIDHEDNEMMRPYNVNPNPLGPWSVTLVAQGPANMNRVEERTKLTEAQLLPTEFSLSQNYPNPFNPTTDIPFALPEDSHVQLKIYNSVGQEIATLIDEFAPAGFHTAKLDAGKLASGIYFYSISAGNFTAMKKMMLIK